MEFASAQHPPVADHKSLWTWNSFSTIALSWQITMVILFSLTVTFAFPYAPSTADGSVQFGIRYAMFQDTHVMMALGFGFLYTLLRRFAWSGVSINYLICALVLQWALLCQGFWTNVLYRYNGTLPSTSFPAIPLTLEGVINADYTVATVLISFGALLGRLSPTQAMVMAFIEVIFSTANFAVMTTLGVADAGGSMVIHVFGAAFGLGLAATFGDKALAGQGGGEEKLGTSRHNGTFAMIGTLFLFCFWPSFNGALLTGDAQARAALNTTLSICASVAVAFALSKAIHRGKSLDMEHIQNATLAGGVAIGAVCDMLINPGAAMATGAVAGAVSTYGFSFFSPALKRAGLTDTCGILDLHLLPGLIGGFASAIGAAVIDPGYGWTPTAIATHFPGRGGRSAGEQGGYQAAMTVISLAFGGLVGAAVGYLLKAPALAWVMEPMEESFYEDSGAWNVPSDAGEEAPEIEALVVRRLAAEKKKLGECGVGLCCAVLCMCVCVPPSRLFYTSLTPPLPPSHSD